MEPRFGTLMERLYLLWAQHSVCTTIAWPRFRQEHLMWHYHQTKDIKVVVSASEVMRGGGSPIASCPPSLLLQILSHLRPLTSALRFTCRLVCSQWQQTSCDPAFWHNVPLPVCGEPDSAEASIVLRVFPTTYLMVDASRLGFGSIAPSQHWARLCALRVHGVQDSAVATITSIVQLCPLLQSLYIKCEGDDEETYDTVEELSMVLHAVPDLQELTVVGHTIGLVPWQAPDETNKPESTSVPLLRSHQSLQALRLWDGQLGPTALAAIILSAPPTLEVLDLECTYDFMEWGEPFFAAIRNAPSHAHLPQGGMRLLRVCGCYGDDLDRYFNNLYGVTEGQVPVCESKVVDCRLDCACGVYHKPCYDRFGCVV